MRFIRISVPTPFYVGDVNVYLVRSDPVTLIDVGPKTPEAADALRRGLAANGVSFGDVRRIVLTHAHEDHCGLARQVRDEAKNAEVMLHRWESGHFAGRLSQEGSRGLLMRAGVPEGVFAEMRRLYDDVALLTDTFSDDELLPLEDGAELEFETGSVRVFHTPGHTPGSCSFFREADRTLVCGDCVLKRITPNPVLSPDPLDPTRRFPSLAEYLVSLARLRSLRPTLAYGGHGEPITDFDEIFNRYVRAIDERQKLAVSLTGGDGLTAYGIARLMFPRADSDVHLFLAVSEAAAHLDLALSEGRLTVELKEGVEIYRRG